MYELINDITPDATKELIHTAIALIVCIIGFFIMEHHFKKIDWFNSLKTGDKLFVLLFSPNGKLYVKATVIEPVKDGYIFIETSSDTKATLQFHQIKVKKILTKPIHPLKYIDRVDVF